MRAGRRFTSWESALNSFTNHLNKETTLSPRTVSFYRETVHAVMRFMEAHNLHTLPHEITADDMIKLLDCMAAHHLATSTRKGYLSALGKFLAYHKNDALEHLDYRLPADTRPRVTWLTYDQARALLEASKKSVLRNLVVHCELCLGMRRVEVIRLRPCDLHDAEKYLDVRGKGPQGGKIRCIPYNKDTREVMDLARERRDCQIAQARPGQAIPENLLLWSKAGKLHSYSEEGYGLDKVVTEPLTKELGFRISNHALRRTFGRAMYHAGVEVAVIARILGHESTDVTLRYIGVNLDDMRAAMAVEIY